MPNSVPIGSGNSCATRPTATGTGCPARNEHTMMSIASGNCAANLLWRRLRMNSSAANGRARPPTRPAPPASVTSPRKCKTADNAPPASFIVIGQQKKKRKKSQSARHKRDQCEGECATRHARFQHQPVEPGDAEAEEAILGQPALAAKLNQDRLAVRLIGQELEPPVHVAAVGGGREAEQ